MKRQLPQWMFGVPSNHQNKTIDSNSNNSCKKDLEDERVKREPKGLKKRKQSSHNDHSNDIDSGIMKRERKGVKNKSKETVEPVDCVKGNPPRSLLVKCRERKRTGENLSPCDEINKNKRNYTKEKEHVRIKNDEDDVASTDCLDDEDDDDLTMEDLMIIANEYIQEGNTSNKVEYSKEKHMSVNQSHGISDSSHSSYDINPTVGRITELTERNYSCNPTTSVNSFECNMSENPTQSMLDVFLGPLLKKTQEKDKRIESKTSDLDIKFEAYKQKNIQAEEKPVTTTMVKKKGSLKEKVMLFLD